MLFAEPQSTAYDWRFSVLGFPVRVHPFFWLMAVLVGWSLSGLDGLGLIIGVSVVFVSILVHELGHALMFRRFGSDCHIVLHGFGGLAIPGQEQGPSSWGYKSSFSRQPTMQEQMIISFAGPAAGFLLAAATIIAVQASGGRFHIERGEMLGIPYLDPVLGGALADNEHLWRLVNALLYVNIYWGLMNLLPVYPLDGGQIAMAMMTLRDPWRGTEKALWMSVMTGAVVAIIGAVTQQLYLVFLFGNLAYSSYMALQQLGGGRPW